MPTNKNALTRYNHLDNLLSDHHHYYDRKMHAERVNEILETGGYKEAGKRTIEYDIIDLQ